MNEVNDFYTETMAKVYASQGYTEKAADIYRYLLKREPDRLDLAARLAELEKRMGEKNHAGENRLVPLFSQWIDVVLKQNKLKQLKKVSKAVSSLPRHSRDK